jgi:DME family drug/metabolite transporter
MIAGMPPSPSDARRGVLEVLAAAVLFGTTGTTAAFAPISASSLAIGAARLVIGGFGLIAALPALGGSRGSLRRLWQTPAGIVGGLMTALYQLTFFAGVSLAGVALGTLVTIGSGPIIVGLLSWFLLGERPTRAWWASTAICLAGLALLTFDGSVQPNVVLGGLALSLAAGAAYAAYTVAAKQLLRRGAHPAEAMAAAFGLSGVLMVPVLLVAGVEWLLLPYGLAIALWLGLVTTTVGYVLFGRGLQVLPAGPVATLVLAEPLVATLLGVGILGEPFGPAGWAGAALVAAGLALQGVTSVRARRGDAASLVESAPA